MYIFPPFSSFCFQAILISSALESTLTTFFGIPYGRTVFYYIYVRTYYILININTEFFSLFVSLILSYLPCLKNKIK